MPNYIIVSRFKTDKGKKWFVRDPGITGPRVFTRKAQSAFVFSAYDAERLISVFRKDESRRPDTDVTRQKYRLRETDRNVMGKVLWIDQLQKEAKQFKKEKRREKVKIKVRREEKTITLAF